MKRKIRETLSPILAKNKLFHPLIKGRSILPFIGDQSHGKIKDSEYTFVMVVRGGFDVNKPNANYMIRRGFCNGFEGLGIAYRIISVWELGKQLKAIKKPIVFLSFYDYFDMDQPTRMQLRDIPHAVWIHPDNDVLSKVYNGFGFEYQKIDDKAYSLVLDSHPSFVFTPSPESAFDVFSKWTETGAKLVSVPLACDTTKYFPKEKESKYSEAEMAFVGGYWEKKAFQFDKYLKPFEDRLKVFGYTHWPYSGYSGLLPEGEESILYQNSTVSPAISEPHAEFTGDIVERVFKIMGSGGLAVTDVIPYYKDLFKPDELLMPSTVAEYKEMVEECLTNEDFNSRYRTAGLKAIFENHTYIHRAQTILEQLGIELND